MIRLFLILRKIIIILVPFAVFFLLKKKENNIAKRKFTHLDFDLLTGIRTGKSKIVDGEIVKNKNKKDG